MEAEPGQDKEIKVEKGTSIAGVAKRLKEKGLIANEYSFIIQAKFFKYQANPGSYTLNTSMTSRDILQMMNENTEEKESKDDSK